ncbi:hypothetical protein [Jeotgalicoccus sp. WY2]|nr:hypothetical protein [Jeotgalicoccus sp. WY2]
MKKEIQKKRTRGDLVASYADVSSLDPAGQMICRPISAETSFMKDCFI